MSRSRSRDVYSLNPGIAHQLGVAQMAACNIKLFAEYAGPLPIARAYGYESGIRDMNQVRGEKLRDVSGSHDPPADGLLKRRRRTHIGDSFLKTRGATRPESFRQDSQP